MQMNVEVTYNEELGWQAIFLDIGQHEYVVHFNHGTLLLCRRPLEEAGSGHAATIVTGYNLGLVYEE